MEETNKEGKVKGKIFDYEKGRSVTFWEYLRKQEETEKEDSEIDIVE